MDFTVDQANWIPVVIRDPETAEGITGIAYDDADLTIKYQQAGGAVTTKLLAEADWVEGTEGTYRIQMSASECSVLGLMTIWAIYTGAETYPGAVNVVAAAASSSAPTGGVPTTPAEALTLANMWQTALNEIATEGQSYTIGRTILTHADLDKCKKMVNYYMGEYVRMTNGQRAGARHLRIIPREY